MHRPKLFGRVGLSVQAFYLLGQYAHHHAVHPGLKRSFDKARLVQVYPESIPDTKHRRSGDAPVGRYANKV